MKAERTTASSAIGRWWYVAVIVVLLAGYTELLDNPVMVDEVQNRGQTYLFATGNWSMNPFITMVPGFHVVLAALCVITGWTSVAAMRFFSLTFSFAVVAAFFVLARETGAQNPVRRTLQFFFLPVLFPYFFLIYTDVLSLVLILLLFYFSFKRRYWLGGMIGLLSCAVRQNNIVWVGLALVVSYLAENGWQWRPLNESFRRFWSYILAGFLFVVFILVNGGVAFGDTAAHPSFSLHLTNVWFLLFVSFFLFLPLAFAHRQKLLELAGRWWFWAAGGVLFGVFALTFVNDHPYNTMLGEYYLRNRLLIFFSSSWVWKTWFFVTAAFAIVLFTQIRLRPNWWLLYPATVLFLLPSWLVEQRYYLIPLTLFLLARKNEDDVIERMQLVWFVIGAIAAFTVINSGRLFL